METVDSSPRERLEGEQPLGRGLGSWGMECEAGWIGGSEFASNVLVCARMCQVERAMGHRAAGKGVSVKWLVPKFWQKRKRRRGENKGEEREGKEGEEEEEEEDRSSSLGIRALKFIFSTK
jgi:hypothetical protein